jgi:limonene-1,2-epoxide hydrolase
VPSPEQYQQTVLDFFKAWEKGTFADIEAAYRHYLAADVFYENSGVPPCRNIEESVAFITAASTLPVLDIQTIRVELRHIAATGNIVFTERTDWHYNTIGKATLVPVICGIMEFNEAGKIQRWADYFDPGPMLAAIG